MADLYETDLGLEKDMALEEETALKVCLSFKWSKRDSFTRWSLSQRDST